MIHEENNRPFMLFSPHKGTTWSHAANTDRFTTISAGWLESRQVKDLSRRSVSSHVRFYGHSPWQTREHKLNLSTESGLLTECVLPGWQSSAQLQDSGRDGLTCGEQTHTTDNWVMAIRWQDLTHSVRLAPPLEVQTVNLINSKYTANISPFFSLKNKDWICVFVRKLALN